MVVTLSRVAREAGVALSTASYALRGSPCINEGTARLVREAADRLGYRRNAQVSTLMAHIRAGRTFRAGERLAFVRLSAPAPGEDQGMMGTLLSAARARAADVGYRVEEFCLDSAGMSQRRLADVLKARGIVGVVLCPRPGRDAIALDWDWGSFSAAVIGNTSCEPELHHAGLNHYAAVRLAMLRLREMGARRIFGLLEQGINVTAKQAVAASFVEHHPLEGQGREWLDLGDGCDEAARDRLRALRPDAVLTTWARWSAGAEIGAPFPPAARVALADWRPNAHGFPGVDHCEAEIAASAVDLVVAQLQRNELGPPAFPHALAFSGVWREDGERKAAPRRSAERPGAGSQPG